MSSIPMPFFATRGASLYTERMKIRTEKETFKKDFENDSISVNNAKDAHRYSRPYMNYIWSQYNKFATFQFQKNLEQVKPDGTLTLLSTQFETLNSTIKH